MSARGTLSSGGVKKFPTVVCQRCVPIPPQSAKSDLASRYSTFGSESHAYLRARSDAGIFGPMSEVSHTSSGPLTRAIPKPPRGCCRWFMMSCVGSPPPNLRGKPAGHTLDATALVHEAYLKLGGDQSFATRSAFMRAAAEAMRRVLVDHARVCE